MRSKKLTDAYIRSLGKMAARYEIADALAKGLYVAVEPTGTKILVHRYSLAGKGVRLTLKPHYPALTLAEARRRVQAQRIMLEEGRDPRAEGKVESQGEEPGHTIETLSVAYIKSRMSCTKPVTYINYAGELGFDVQDGAIVPSRSEFRPRHFWADRTPQSLTKEEIKAFIDKIVEECGRSQAAHIFATLTRLFKWADKQDMPTSLIMGKIESPMVRRTKRQRLLTPYELTRIWEAACRLEPAEKNYHPERDIIHWLILTGQRVAQAVYAEHSDFDLREKIWRIPGEKPGSKNVPNLLPLTDEMLRIIQSCPHKTGYLFSYKGGRTPCAAKGATKRKILKFLAEEGHVFPNWTFHDFRRIYRTTLSSFPIPHADKVCELLIGHTLPGVEPIYNLYKYLPEKRIGMEAWAEWLKDTIAASSSVECAERLAA